MTKFFFDMDGTIVNSQGRLYELFCELCPENIFSYEEYWEIKRKHVTQKEFLQKYFHYSEEKIDNFHKIWLDKVEEEKRVLTYDFPVNGMSDILKKLAEKHRLFLLTNRQSYEIAVRQMEQFGWLGFFDDLFITQQRDSKQELIRKSKIVIEKSDFFIGDTGEDIKTAKEFGAKSVAVTWGVLDSKVLEKYEPDLIVGNPRQLLTLI